MLLAARATGVDVVTVRLIYCQRRFWLEVNGLPMAKLPFQMTLKQVRDALEGLNEVAA